MDPVGAVAMVLLTAALFAVWRAQARDRGRWRQSFRERTWLRAMAWTAALTAAGALGSIVSAGIDVALAVVAVGVPRC